MSRFTRIDALPQSIDHCIDRVRTVWENIGVAVAVVAGGEVVYARGHGVREAGRPEPIDEHTLFQIGSTSKAFATAALGLLVDEGALDWDDRVIYHLPSFWLRDPWLTRQLTIRDILTHRTGLGPSLYPFCTVTDLDGTVAQLRHVPSQGRFRDCFVYDNLLYAVAGKVTEAVSGRSWHDFVKSRLLQPLGMTRSGTSPYDVWDEAHVTPTFLGSVAETPSHTQARVENVAMPHGWDEDGSAVVLPWQCYDNAAAAGAVISSAADMANWLILHLVEGRFRGTQLLSEQTLRELHTTQNLHDGGAPFSFMQTSQGYALGWWRATYRGYVHLSHGGGILGFPAYAAILPERGLGVVVLGNGSRIRGGAWARGDYPAIFTFHQATALSILDLLLDVEPRDWPAELAEVAREQQSASRKAEVELLAARDPSAGALPIAEYAGTYEDGEGGSGPVKITVESGGLQLAFASPGAYAAKLEPWRSGVFRLCSQPVVWDVLHAIGPSHEFVSFLPGPLGIATMTMFGARFARVDQPSADA